MLRGFGVNEFSMRVRRRRMRRRRNVRNNDTVLALVTLTK